MLSLSNQFPCSVHSLAVLLSMEFWYLELWKCRLEFGDENDHVIKFLSLNSNLSFGKRENWGCT